MMNYSYHKKVKNAPVLILLHGYGETGEIWKGVADKLEGINIIIPTLPGWDHTPVPGEVTMEQCAGWINEILEKEKINECLLAGHSMGGYIAMAFAELYPGKLTGSGLIHSSSYADSSEKKEAREKSIRFIEQHGVEKYVKEFVPNLFATAFVKDKPEIIAKQISEARMIPPATWIAYLKAMSQRKDRSAYLLLRKIPFLFVIGREDNIIPYEVMLKQCHIPDTSCVHILNDAGHMGMIESEDEVVKALREFTAYCAAFQ